jgi:hypothetical protein
MGFLWWKCIENFHLLKLLHFTVEWVSNLNFEAIIRIAFTISSDWVFDSSLLRRHFNIYLFNAQRLLFTVSSALYSLPIGVCFGSTGKFSCCWQIVIFISMKEFACRLKWKWRFMIIYNATNLDNNFLKRERRSGKCSLGAINLKNIQCGRFRSSLDGLLIQVCFWASGFCDVLSTSRKCNIEVFVVA